MSNNQTNWILNLVDKITGPMKSITAATSHQSDAIKDVQERVVLSAKDTKTALSNEKKHRSDLINKIKEEEQAIKDLEKAAEKIAPGKKQAEAIQEIAKAKAKLEDLRETLKGTDQDINDLGNDLGKFQQKAARWDQVATGFNQFGELVDKVAGSLDFTTEIQATQTNIQRMTGVTGGALQAMTGDVHRLGKVFGESDDEIAVAANSISKQMGISFEGSGLKSMMG